MNDQEKQVTDDQQENEIIPVEDKKNFMERNRVFQFSEVIVSNTKLFQLILLIGVLFEIYKMIFKYRLQKDWFNIVISLFFISIYVYIIYHLKTKKERIDDMEK